MLPVADKSLSDSALALARTRIGSAFTLLSGSEELEAPKLLIVNHICNQALITEGCGDCRCMCG
jgi:hypothetical protein